MHIINIIFKEERNENDFHNYDRIEEDNFEINNFHNYGGYEVDEYPIFI